MKDYRRNDDDDDEGKKKQIRLPIYYASSHIDNMVGELNNKRCLELLYGMRKMRGKSFHTDISDISIDKERKCLLWSENHKCHHGCPFDGLFGG